MNSSQEKRLRMKFAINVKLLIVIKPRRQCASNGKLKIKRYDKYYLFFCINIASLVQSKLQFGTATTLPAGILERRLSS